MPTGAGMALKDAEDASVTGGPCLLPVRKGDGAFRTGPARPGRGGHGRPFRDPRRFVSRAGIKAMRTEMHDMEGRLNERIDITNENMQAQLAEQQQDIGKIKSTVDKLASA